MLLTISGDIYTHMHARTSDHACTSDRSCAQAVHVGTNEGRLLHNAHKDTHSTLRLGAWRSFCHTFKSPFCKHTSRITAQHIHTCQSPVTLHYAMHCASADQTDRSLLSILVVLHTHGDTTNRTIG